MEWSSNNVTDDVIFTDVFDDVTTDDVTEIGTFDGDISMDPEQGEQDEGMLSTATLESTPAEFEGTAKETMLLEMICQIHVPLLCIFYIHIFNPFSSHIYYTKNNFTFFTNSTITIH